jgi:hypothetical protein
MLREELFLPPAAPSPAESRVLLHDNPDLAADLTLERGRVFLRNPQKKELTARVRIENPTNPELREVWDLTLEQDAQVLVDVVYFYPLEEPFFPNPDDPSRKGPVAIVQLLVVDGAISLRHDDRSERMEAPPRAGYITWISTQGIVQRQVLPSVPDWLRAKPPLPADLDARVRKRLSDLRENMFAARDSLVKSLRGKQANVDVNLAGILKTSSHKEEQVLAVRCYGALDDLANLVDALGNEDKNAVRAAAADTLRSWIAYRRDNDYRLVAELKEKYNANEAETIVKLLHYLPAQEAMRQETFDFLILNLTNQKIALRELAYWHLYRLAPELGSKIPYSASARLDQRQQAQARWYQLLQQGRLPPRQQQPGAPMGEGAGKKGP